MRKYCVGLSFLILSLTCVAQSNGDHPASRVFQRLVIDIGATPVSFSNPSRVDQYFYNFAIGYQFKNNLELKFHWDLIQAFQTVSMGAWNDFTTFDRLFAMGVGGNYRWYSQKTQGLFNGVSYSVALKAGATFSQDYREQQSIYYDISARLYPKKNVYFATGFNHDLFTMRSFLPSNKEHVETFYFSFGLDF
jgi:hypothetical protein